MSLLSVAGVGVSFGGVRALADVSLELNRGEILGLIGPNGAGKTTLFNCISGVLTPERGRILFEDESVSGLKPHQRAQRGIARTFQNLQLWGTMTVLENCQMPIDALGGRSILADALRLPWSGSAEKASIERARAILHALDLLQYADRLAADLSVGIQRRVEIARALCMRPKLLLLDEPASGLDAEETIHLADLLSRIRDRFKVSILLVDHDMSLVMRACDYIYVLDFGELISSGKPEVVRDDPKVIAAYLGEGREEPEEEPSSVSVTPRRPPGSQLGAAARESGPPLLEVKGLNAGYGGIEVVRDVNLRVEKGEVVACIGANGAGKTTTLRAISGVLKPTAGSVIFDGRDITGRAAEAIVRAGMVHVPQGRGLFPKLSVQETLELAQYSGHDGKNYDVVFAAFPVLKDRRGQLVGTLSGGQQQMVAMARALLVKPKLLLVDEMSQGLAPAVVQQLFDRIDIFKKEGIAVFLVEQFVDSALAVADRAYVFEQGTVAHEAEAKVLRADQAVIASSYLGSAVEVESPGEAVASGKGYGVNGHHPLESMAVKLPAEMKRALQERAAREGKNTDELMLELLGTGASPGGRK
ncbi:MAG: ATP-binding cassette domain-containing protein [Candidatus Dormibacteria bacterium]